jgi:hypothetical protein
MHYGAYVHGTFPTTYVQWFKSYRPFASHRMFWELSVLQWFTVNFTGLSPRTDWQFFMRRNIFFMPNNKWQLEMHALMNDIKACQDTVLMFTVVSIIKSGSNENSSPSQVLLYSISEWVADQILVQNPISIWFGLNILLFFSKTMKKDLICKFLQSLYVLKCFVYMHVFTCICYF